MTEPVGVVLGQMVGGIFSPMEARGCERGWVCGDLIARTPLSGIFGMDYHYYYIRSIAGRGPVSWLGAESRILRLFVHVGLLS